MSLEATKNQGGPQEESGAEPPVKSLTGELRVTWLLPVKNGMPYLPETLTSIEAQTYRNFEILAWDNGSTDGTLEELQSWIPSRLPGRIISDRPLGLGASLREMVLEARTELCARIDADDVNLSQRLKKQVAFLDAHPDIALVGSQTNRLDADGVNHGRFMPVPLLHNEIVDYMLARTGIMHPTVLFRRDAVLAAGNYRDVGEINIEDYDLWLRLALNHKLANLDAVLLNYRVHAKGTTEIAIQQNRLNDALDHRFCEHAPALYGITAEEARMLRERCHPRAIEVLRRIAQRLEQTQSGAPQHPMRSKAFIESGLMLTSEKDFASRLMLVWMDGRPSVARREAYYLVKKALKSRQSRK